MGLIENILGIGRGATKIGKAIEGVSEVFVPNRSKSEAYQFQRAQASLQQLSAEFALAPNGTFDSFVNGLNRLPRPTLALGTVGLLVYAMADPAGFTLRMQGLNTVPQPLWWLLGAIVSFYFGAREMHYKREDKKPLLAQRNPATPIARPKAEDNAALREWHETQK